MSKEKEEKKLGLWLSNQKRALNGKGYGKMRRRLLEEHLPEWFHYDQEKEWMENLIKCVEFYTKNKKTPSQTSKYKEEKTLAQWLSGQRTTLNGKGYMTDERRRLLEEHLPEWFHYDQEKEQEKKWMKYLMKCVEFYAKNKKFPSESSKDEEEKKLCKWLSHQRQALNGKGSNKMTEERRKLLQENIPDWFNRPSRLSSTRDSPDSSNLSSDTDDI
jgi:Fe-S cluster biosynthesis and repair protein YggX